MISRLYRAAVAASFPGGWLPLLELLLVLSAAPAWGQDAVPLPKELPLVLKGQALIVVGLPGDQDHEKLFADTVKQWRSWLTDKLGFNGTDVHVLSGNALPEGDSPIFAERKSGQSPAEKKGGEQKGATQWPVNREAIEKEAARLKQSLHPDERLWVFFLGHANFDGQHAWFHLPGPDIREDEIGKLFAGINCREQVFWMTTAESGRFIKDLSAKGRIVIAATRVSGEDNETEFPHALATVASRPLSELDFNNDGKLALLELYYRVLVEVQARYNADKRLPTEHALLDDNGDGVGIERPLVADPSKKPGPEDDGMLSLSTILPYPNPPPKQEPSKTIRDSTPKP